MKKLLSIVLTTIITASLFAGQVFYVVEGGAGNKDGTSWANAFADVQSAVNAAEAVSSYSKPGKAEIWIAKGTYKQSTVITITVGRNIGFYGGFAGNETTKEDRIDGNETILDGENKYGIIKICDSSVTNLIFDNLIFQNSSSGYGLDLGYASYVEVKDCVFLNNNGGIYTNGNGGHSIVNCEFKENKITSIYLKYTGANISNCIFNGNDDTAIRILGDDWREVNIENCTFTGNKKVGNSYGGSDLEINADYVTVTNCSFENPKFVGESACLYLEPYSCDRECRPKIVNCTFSGAKGTNEWGQSVGYAVHNRSGATFENCTFADNNYAIKNNYEYNAENIQPTFINCTFANNSSGMENITCSPTITNCIFWNNNQSFNSYNLSLPVINSCIIDSWDNVGSATNVILYKDPLLMPLGNYGGFVKTMPVCSGSSAINAGTGVLLETDARGISRNYSNPTIGACEFANNLTGVGAFVKLDVKYTKDYVFTLNSSVPDMTDYELRNVTYQWYKDGEKIEGATNATYSTSQVEPKATYTVKAKYNNVEFESNSIAIETVDKAPVIYVSTEGNSQNDGLSWATAKSNIQEAIDLASKYKVCNAEVWIAKGTYKHGGTITIYNNNYVSIYGGFAGTEKTKEERTFGNVTTLDGEEKHQIMKIYSLSCALDNLFFTNGRNAITTGYNSNTIITNCTFSNNKSFGQYPRGGALMIYGDAVITNSTFVNNSVEKTGTSMGDCGGGAINIYSSGNVTIVNSTFTQNKATGEYCNGGAILLKNGSNLKLVNCILWGNTGTDGEISEGDFGTLKYSATSCIIKNSQTSDPLLGEFGMHGGNVPTIPVAEGSSAIGGGVVTSETPKTDARGVTRSVIASTIGAYEFLVTEITSNPEDVVAWANSDVKFKVSTTTDSAIFQWQYSKDGSTWADIVGAITSELVLKNVEYSKNGYQYRCGVGGDTTDLTYSTPALLTLKPIPEVNNQPSSIEIFTEKNGSLSVSATGEELTYQWYFNGEAIEGATSATLSFEKIQIDKTGSYYCVITNPAGSVQSNAATITVRQSVSAETISQGLKDVSTVSNVGYARFVVETTAYNPTYKWYYGSDSTRWTEIENENSNTLFIPAERQYTNKNIKCEISNAGGTTSTQALLSYKSDAIQITSQPQDVVCSSNENATFSVVATTSTGNIFYQWQYSVDGNEWTNIENATESTYVFKLQDFAKCGYYRCEVDNGGGILYSEKAKLNGVISIISQPQDVSAFAGNPVEFTVDVGNVAGVSYQWQVSKNNGTSWANVSKAISSTYTTTMTAEMNAWQYRCKLVVSGIEDTFSNVAKLMLLEDVAITTQPVVVSSAIIGTKATFTIEASGYEPKYQWQVSYDYGDTWENIAGATNATLCVDVVENIIENSYRCLIWNDNNVDAPLESEMVWIENAQQPTAFQKWSIENGLGVDALPTATPHNDGITNLEKFAFGLDASKATSYDANSNIKYSTDASGNATLQFPVSVDAEGVVNVKALKSVDLINWTETTATATGETSADGKFKIYKATAPVGEEGKVFLKLQVEEK